MNASPAHKAPVAAPDKIPAHVAIIMDGNGRWAKARGLPRAMGHKKGAEALRTLLDHCQKLGLRYLTLYAFSSENWKRPSNEITDLMELLRYYLKREVETIHKGGIRLRVIGDTSRLQEDIREDIRQAESLTANNKNFHLNIALSYGSRQELVEAAKQIVADAKSGKISPDALTEEMISDYLYTKEIPDPDLLIRTGGDQRLSNFLLWQSAYTELYFTPVLWPDFTPEHLKEAIGEYARRERRYGSTAE